MGDAVEPTQPEARPQEFLLATSYDSRDPRLLRKEAATGGGAEEDRQPKRQRYEQATPLQDLSWDHPDWAELLGDDHLACLPAPSTTPPLSQQLPPQDLQAVTAFPLTLSEEEAASQLEKRATKVDEWVERLDEDDQSGEQQKEK